MVMEREGMKVRDGARGNESYGARWNENESERERERLRMGGNESEDCDMF